MLVFIFLQYVLHSLFSYLPTYEKYSELPIQSTVNISGGILIVDGT